MSDQLDLFEKFTDEQKAEILKRYNLTKDLSPLELRALKRSAAKNSGTTRQGILRHRHQYPKNHAKIGYMSDLHAGHEKFKEALFTHAMRTFRKEGVDSVMCAGDLTEGMSGRPGHVYELKHMGYSAQAKYLEQLFGAFPDIHVFGIDGNHDEWYANKNNAGVVVGEELESKVENYHHLGQMEAIVELNPNTIIHLYHGRDGTAYAISYKMQKLMESYTGGEKPSVILSGHYHKHLTMWNRNIFGVECGTMCGQTAFMRGKKIPAHMGFGILDIYYNKRGVDRIDHSWHPWYEKESKLKKHDYASIVDLGANSKKK